jgi:hypothetical protein
MSEERDLTARAVNAAAGAAAMEVYEYAHRFKRREDYQPLDELPARVQRAAIEAAVAVMNEAEEKQA